MNAPRILILTVPHGASHQRVADALKKGLLKIEPRCAVRIEDLLELSPQWFRYYYNSYLIPLRYCPKVWEWIESLQHTRHSTAPLWLYRQAAKSLAKFISLFQPDIVIATEVGTCEIAALTKREWQFSFTLVGAITGIDVDRAWAQREVDIFVLSPDGGTAALEQAGVALDKIFDCGQPVDPAFARLPSKSLLRARLGIEARIPLLVALFGGTGIGRPRRIVAELKKIRRPIQAVFISGRNKRLRAELEQLTKPHKNFKVFGWVENIDEWMAAADLVVSKPGASTLIETLNCGTPLIAFDPLPGNERRACDWIERLAVGRAAKRVSDIAPLIEYLLAHTEELNWLKNNARLFARPNAACEAAARILTAASPAACAESLDEGLVVCGA